MPESRSYSPDPRQRLLNQFLLSLIFCPIIFVTGQFCFSWRIHAMELAENRQLEVDEATKRFDSAPKWDREKEKIDLIRKKSLNGDFVGEFVLGSSSLFLLLSLALVSTAIARFTRAMIWPFIVSIVCILWVLNSFDIETTDAKVALIVAAIAPAIVTIPLAIFAFIRRGTKNQDLSESFGIDKEIDQDVAMFKLHGLIALCSGVIFAIAAFIYFGWLVENMQKSALLVPAYESSKAAMDRAEKRKEEVDLGFTEIFSAGSEKRKAYLRAVEAEDAAQEKFDAIDSEYDSYRYTPYFFLLLPMIVVGLAGASTIATMQDGEVFVRPIVLVGFVFSILACMFLTMSWATQYAQIAAGSFALAPILVPGYQFLSIIGLQRRHRHLYEQQQVELRDQYAREELKRARRLQRTEKEMEKQRIIENEQKAIRAKEKIEREKVKAEQEKKQAEIDATNAAIELEKQRQATFKAEEALAESRKRDAEAARQREKEAQEALRERQQLEKAARDKAAANQLKADNEELSSHQQRENQLSATSPPPTRLYSPPYASESLREMARIENEIRLLPEKDSFASCLVNVETLNPELPLPIKMFSHYREFFRDFYVELMQRLPDKSLHDESLEQFCESLFERDADLLIREGSLLVDKFAEKAKRTSDVALFQEAKEEELMRLADVASIQNPDGTANERETWVSQQIRIWEENWHQ